MSSLSIQPVLEAFQNLFAELRPDVAMPLEEVYAPDIVFQDPAHRVNGLAALRAYFERLNANLEVARFDYEPSLIDGDRAMVPWRGTISLRRGPRGTIVYHGVSHLRVRAGGAVGDGAGDGAPRIVMQRDYFDLGELVYEHVPLLASAVRFIKRRL